MVCYKASPPLLYQYSFPLIANKTATGLTLPNNTNLVMLGALVTVSPSNSVPVLAPISGRSVTADSTLSLTATASDADQPPQHFLTFTLPIAPAGASVDAATGVFDMAPNHCASGRQSVYAGRHGQRFAELERDANF